MIVKDAILEACADPAVVSDGGPQCSEDGLGALEADAAQTSLCAYLSAIALAGVGLNAALGWWWADPVAALAMLPIIVKEGLGGVQSESCDC